MSRRHVAAAGCALAITAFAPATVPAGTARQVAGTSAAVLSRKPPPGMLDALQRDLGLSPEQARARLINEARLILAEAHIRHRLGDRFAGSWLRGNSAHTLVVATTSAADIPMILEAGAQAEVVTRSLAQLTPIKRKLERALPVRPLVASVRYIDVKTNRVVVLTNRPEAARTLIENAGVDKSAVVVLPSTEQPQPLTDLVGGNAYYIGVLSRCSIGFSVTRGSQNGFISAGHCGKVGETTTGFNRVAQGVFEASTFPISDYAWVSVNSDWTPTATVDNGEGGSVPVAGSRPALEGASVCRSGSTTDWHCGLIQQRDASITYPQGNVFGLTRTSVCAERGDSGGPFISIDQAQGIASGGSGDCTTGGTTYFQPINPVLTAYGLTLVTSLGNPPPPTTGTCTGYPKSGNGTLSDGQTAYQPAAPYTSNVGGIHHGCLDGGDTTDFDLYLQKWNGTSWRTVAVSEGPSATERIDYTGTAGRYRYMVVSSSGSGPYLLGFTTP